VVLVVLAASEVLVVVVEAVAAEALAAEADVASKDRRTMSKQDTVELLAFHGVKPTANRILVASELEAAGRPLSLSELEAKIKTIDKSGIFRALTLFREHHLVHVIEDGGDGVRYELCHSHDEEHDDDIHVHFYCERCRRTYCLEDTKIPPVELPGGFVMNAVNYMVKGICPACRKGEH
jgi:Fur family ferric uptake transcriptional regulator